MLWQTTNPTDRGARAPRSVPLPACSTGGCQPVSRRLSSARIGWLRRAMCVFVRGSGAAAAEGACCADGEECEAARLWDYGVVYRQCRAGRWSTFPGTEVPRCGRSGFVRVAHQPAEVCAGRVEPVLHVGNHPGLRAEGGSAGCPEGGRAACGSEVAAGGCPGGGAEEAEVPGGVVGGGQCAGPGSRGGAFAPIGQQWVEFEDVAAGSRAGPQDLQCECDGVDD